MQLTRRFVAILALVGVVALLVVAAGRDLASAGGAGKYNSMNQMKTVLPCTAQTTLVKVSDKPGPPAVGADPGDTITYTVTETNNAQGSCLLDTDSNGVMDTLRVTGTYVLENRGGSGSGHINNPCDPGGTGDPRATCVLDVLDWVETHNPGEGNLWHALHVNGGAPSDTHSGNQLDGQRNVDYYCPSDSSGPMPDLDGDTLPGGGNTLANDKCAPSAQPLYGTLVTALTPNTSLPCGQPGGSSCFGAPQVYTYTLTVPLGAGQADMLASADGIRNVAHFDMFNEELSNSGRNHFTRASFTSASLGSNAYNVTVTDTAPQAPGDGDSCTANWPFTSCVATATGWVANGATLPGGASGTVAVKYKVRDDECEKVITNVANATHTDVTGTKVSDEGPASALTRIRDCPRLTVNKDLVPGLDPGQFNLLIDDSTEAADVGAGGTTGPKKMTIATHTASETAGTDTDLADYATAIGGDCDPTDGSIDLKAGDDKTCTVTNLRKPKLTVCKELVPGTDPGKFNLLIDGVEKATNVGDGGCTGAVVVDIGTHTVGETAGTDTNLGDYLTPSIGGSCTDNGNGTGSIDLKAGDNLTCTITNTKVPTLTVTKVLEPSGDDGRFDLKIDNVVVRANAGDGDSGAAPVSIGITHTVSETAVSPTNPANYTTVINGDCAADGTVTLAAGDNKTCNITNSRKPTLEVKKILSPSTDPGKFNLWIGSTKYASDVGDGGTTGALVFAPGTYTVSETAGTGTNLADYDTVIGSECTAGGSVTLVPGDVKVCTITNTRKVAGWTAHSQGFWRNSGPDVYDKSPADGNLDTPVSIGGGLRGKTVTTNADANTILDGVGSTPDQKASCLLVVGNEDCTTLDAKPKDVVSRADLAKLMGHTMALEFNIVYLNGGVTTAKISDITEAACTTPAMITNLTKLSLTTSSTVGAVRIRANGLINDSPFGGVETTSTEMTAMIALLGNCVNANHAVVPGDRDWDGVPEDVDNCPGIYNPDQSDVDGDGIGDDCDADMDNDSRGVTVGGVPAFTDAAEGYMGTDERRDCGLDAWGPDFNGDGSVDIFDVADIKAHFNTAAGNPAYMARDDLSADGYINIVDLAVMKRFFLETCAGVDPIQPGAP